MVVFADTDIVIKLCGFNLMDRVVSLCGTQVEEVCVHPELPALLKGRRDLERQISQDGVKRLTEFASRAKHLRERPTGDAMRMIAEVESLDAGEVLLFHAAASSSDGVVLTSDRKALRALGDDPTVRTLLEGLRGRVVCLESLLLALIQRYKFPVVRDGICNALDADRGLRSIFTAGKATSVNAAVLGLQSRVRSLEDQLGTGWFKHLA